ncbi:MAG: glycosyltransferase family 4 protein [Acidimicrobiales bacterium]
MSTAIEVHQFVPSLAVYDAVGQHSIALQQFLQSLGVESTLYADEIKPGAEAYAVHYSKFTPQSSQRRLLVYQASTASPIAEFLEERPEIKLVNFHNVTPPEFASGWDLGVATAMMRALGELERFASVTDLAFTVSRFNMQDLESLGYRSVALATPFITLERRFARSPRVVDRGARWLFVGRVFPNKAQLELVRAFAAYRAIYDEQASLAIVGGRSCLPYVDALEALIEGLGMSDAVTLVGQVDDETLAAHYREADVFTCMSRHEGFCFPVVEAMRNDLPVVAFAAAAVPETIGDAGVLVQNDDPLDFAAAVGMVLRDEGLQRQLSRSASLQLDRFGHDRAHEAHLEVFRPYLERMESM